VTDAWVVNASPIILYARIGRLDVIERLAPRVVVPETVIEEIQAGVQKDSTAAEAVSWAYSIKEETSPSHPKWNAGTLLQENLRLSASVCKENDGRFLMTGWRGVASMHMACR